MQYELIVLKIHIVEPACTLLPQIVAFYSKKYTPALPYLLK